MTSMLNRSPLAHRRYVDRCAPPGFQASAVSLLHIIDESLAHQRPAAAATRYVQRRPTYSRRPDTAAPIPSKLYADTFPVGVHSQGCELYELPSRMFLCIARLTRRVLPQDASADPSQTLSSFVHDIVYCYVARRFVPAVLMSVVSSHCLPTERWSG